MKNSFAEASVILMYTHASTSQERTGLRVNSAWIFWHILETAFSGSITKISIYAQLFINLILRFTETNWDNHMDFMELHSFQDFLLMSPLSRYHTYTFYYSKTDS